MKGIIRGKESRLPVYQEMIDAIRKAIKSGDLKEGDWLQGEHTFCKEYGISRGSVRKALSILTSEGLVKSFPGKGIQIINNKRGALQEIVIFCPFASSISSDGFYGILYDRLNKLCKEKEIKFQYICHDRSIGSDSFWDTVTFDISTGIILLAETFIDQLPSREKYIGPVIQLDHRIPELPFDSVMVDAVMSGREAVKHLYDLGHRDINYLGWQFEETYNPERKKGVMEGLLETGLAVDPQRFTACEDRFEGGREAVHQLLDNSIEFTAIIVYHAGIARGAIHACKERGLRVPEDISIICFGRESETRPDDMPLAYIDCDPAGLAEKGFKRLVYRSKNPDASAEHILNPVTVVQGKTSGKLKA
ncbi:substrate-binding domain-containing protein [Planctomycetota bacterium]